jgi:hypothetical protein
MSRPSFQFYPKDWRNNANLRRCSPAARGAWIDVLCVLHDSDEYGILRWKLKDLAMAAAASIGLLRELVEKSVLKGIDRGQVEPYIYIPRSGRREGAPVELIAAQPGPIWYSSRMVRDEYVRTTAGASTRFGVVSPVTKPAAIDAPRRSPSRRQGDDQGVDQGDGSSSSSSTAVNSVPIGTGRKAPKTVDPDEIIFGYGVPMLTAAGSTDKHARSFLGMLRKKHGDATVVNTLRECVKAKPLQPLEWLAAALPPGGAASKQNAQELLEESNRQIAERMILRDKNGTI